MRRDDKGQIIEHGMTRWFEFNFKSALFKKESGVNFNLKFKQVLFKG